MTTIQAPQPRTGIHLNAVLRLLVLLVMQAMIFGCATVAPPAPRSEGPAPIDLSEQRRLQLAKIDTWDIKGRLGVQREEEGFSASLEWKQNGQVSDIRLFDPLGRRVAWLVSDRGEVNLLTGDGKDLRSDNPEELMQTHLGWSFPVRSLFHWIKGIPDPDEVAWREEYDDVGRLVKLEQSGWSMTVERFLGEDPLARPALAVLEREKMRVKVLVNEWR
ncbi:MAG: lipoprotein insertase outer membrane protein LolB [Thiotrichales bacterium]